MDCHFLFKHVFQDDRIDLRGGVLSVFVGVTVSVIVGVTVSVSDGVTDGVTVSVTV